MIKLKPLSIVLLTIVIDVSFVFLNWYKFRLFGYQNSKLYILQYFTFIKLYLSITIQIIDDIRYWLTNPSFLNVACFESINDIENLTTGKIFFLYIIVFQLTIDDKEGKGLKTKILNLLLIPVIILIPRAWFSMIIGFCSTWPFIYTVFLVLPLIGLPTFYPKAESWLKKNNLSEISPSQLFLNEHKTYFVRAVRDDKDIEIEGAESNNLFILTFVLVSYFFILMNLLGMRFYGWCLDKCTYNESFLFTSDLRLSLTDWVIQSVNDVSGLL